MKFENTEVFNFEGALRGMRNPLESWGKSDSELIYMCNNLGPKEEPHECTCCPCGCVPDFSNSMYKIGPNDLQLAQKLIAGGSEHRKFLRQIFVSVDITAPLYWWKEADTYSVGITKNSTSTMHTIIKHPIIIEDFELDDFCTPLESVYFHDTVYNCNQYRDGYLKNKDTDPELAKKYWKALIRILPESYLQTRTVTMNYENLRSIVKQRAGHKLTEWHAFVDWVKTLPYADQFIFYKSDTSQ